MSSCLGLYIEEKIIKYAKVSKERDNIKVEAFGLKCYDRLDTAISQIISETNSSKVPVSISLSNEIYNYFYMFSALKKADMEKAIDTEFYSYCEEKKINKNAFESRFILVDGLEEKDRLKAIYVSCNKTEINQKIQDLPGLRVTTVTPLPIAISNVMKVGPKDNVLVVNIEKNTTITSIIDGKIFSVHRLSEGTGNFLSSIAARENSYSKAYDIIKNTTIYTMGSTEIPEESNPYLDDIMPSLYKIVQATKKVENMAPNNIDSIYITGSGAMVNNVDMYFQEYFENSKCEILKPYFVGNEVKLNIKDYIEVNSALALALQGLGEGIQSMNFKKQSFSFNDLFALEIGGGKSPKGSGKKLDFSLNLSEGLDDAEHWMLRVASGLLMIVIVYLVMSFAINKQIDNKYQEVTTVKSQVSKEMGKVESDISSVKSATNGYNQKTESIEDLTKEITDNTRGKNAISTLLSNIMYIIPKEVVITSIENTTDNKVVIQAQSSKYEQLGYFKAKLRVDGVLQPDTIKSTSGVKQDGIIKVTIEGDLL